MRRRPVYWRRCTACRRKATHYIVADGREDIPLCQNHAAAHAAVGAAVHRYPPQTGPAIQRLRRLFHHAAREAERLGHRELAEAVRTLVHAALLEANH
jgi:hypothetical protein